MGELYKFGFLMPVLPLLIGTYGLS